MPVIIDKTIHLHTRLAVWEITEGETELRGQLILNNNELDFLASIKIEKKRLQWLASRCLVRMIMNTPQHIAMHSSSSGQPLMSDSHKKVSISHAGHHAAVIMSDECEVGIDIEEISPKILSIKHKYIGEEEMLWMKDETDIEKYLLMWSAKESLFKWYAKGEVDFRQHLRLQNFNKEKQGIIGTRFVNGMTDKNLEIHYEIFSNCVMTWVVE